MKLTFHAGLPKTGSSYIQQFALLNKGLLESHGVHYPVGEDLVARRDKVRNPPGNGVAIHQVLLEGNNGQFEDQIDAVLQSAPTGTRTILLSHEGFYNSLTRLTSETIQILKDRRVDQVKTILYVRDPIEWLFSLYKQRCRRGDRLSISEFLHENNSIEMFLRFVGFSSENEFLCPVFLDFQACKANLVGSILSNITASRELAEEELELPNGIVNRSLSLREIRFLQLASRVASRSIVYRISEFMSKWESSLKDSKGLMQFTRVLNEEPSSAREVETFYALTRPMFRTQGQYLTDDG